KADYNWAQDGDAFAHWALSNILSLTENETFSEVCVGAKDDKAVDGFYVDPERRVVHIFQSKYQTESASFGDRAALADFLRVPQRLADERISTQFKNLEIRRCARRYRDAVRDGYVVTMHFAALGNPTSSVMDEILLAPQVLPAKHELVFWGFKKLEDLYYQQMGFDEPIDENVSFKLASASSLSMDTVKAH